MLPECRLAHLQTRNLEHNELNTDNSEEIGPHSESEDLEIRAQETIQRSDIEEENRDFDRKLRELHQEVSAAWNSTPAPLWGVGRYNRLHGLNLQKGTRTYEAYYNSIRYEMMDLRHLRLRCEQARVEVFQRRENGVSEDPKEIVWVDAICQAINKLHDCVHEQVFCLLEEDADEYLRKCENGLAKWCL